MGLGFLFLLITILAAVIDVDSALEGDSLYLDRFSLSFTVFFFLSASWKLIKTAFMALVCWVLYGWRVFFQ